MNKRIFPAVMAAIVLTSCAGTAPQQPAGNEDAVQPVAAQTEAAIAAEAETTAALTAPYTLEDQVMPVINIVTASGSNDFAAKPVNGYVSSQIATWTPDYVMPPEPYYEDCTVTISDNDGVLLCADAQVKVRGNWTTSYDKKPLRIKFKEKQSVGISDGDKDKNWLLLSEYKDMSLLRNKAALNISEGILAPDGYYSADCELVEVLINGKYWGVYLLTEQQQTGKDRVAVTEPEKDYTGTDIGYFLEMDGYFFLEDPLQQFHVSYNYNAPLIPYDGNGGSGKTIACLSDDNVYRKDIGFTIKNDIYSQAQHDFIADYVENVYLIMYHAAYDHEAYIFTDDYSDIVKADISPEEAVRAVVDVDSLADMYIISEVTCDADLYWSSFFMSADFGEGGNRKLTFCAPWDFDSGLGNKDRCIDGKGFFAANSIPEVNGNEFENEYEAVNPWLAVLMYEDWYTDIIREKWTRAYDSGIFDSTLEMIESDISTYQKAFDRNFERWDYEANKWIVIGELSEPAAHCNSQQESAEWLHKWLASRIEFLNEQWHE
ncbi:MAG: CotH kinase family protein [Oscillospiraceae bacterium]|nr:CotH kinase family protein [Oscillospiraceae bacterium]